MLIVMDVRSFGGSDKEDWMNTLRQSCYSLWKVPSIPATWWPPSFSSLPYLNFNFLKSSWIYFFHLWQPKNLEVLLTWVSGGHQAILKGKKSHIFKPNFSIRCPRASSPILHHSSSCFHLDVWLTSKRVTTHFWVLLTQSLRTSHLGWSEGAGQLLFIRSCGWSQTNKMHRQLGIHQTNQTSKTELNITICSKIPKFSRHWNYWFCESNVLSAFMKLYLF